VQRTSPDNAVPEVAGGECHEHLAVILGRHRRNLV